MKRPLLAILLLLLLGLCSSLLVAWAGALVDRDGWPDTPLTGAPVGTRTGMRGWLVEEGRDRTLTWRTFDALDLWDQPPDLDARTELAAWSVGHGLADQPGPFAPARERTRLVAWEVSAGWPVRCVRATRGAGPSEFALPGEFVRGGLAAMAYGWPMPHGAAAGHEGIEVAPWPIDGLAATIPLRPMVGGLLANTLVHALVWGVLLLPLCLLGPLRRRRRARKNRCPACGHARDGLPIGAPCAECGRDPNARTPLRAMLAARTPMRGAALALLVVFSASAALVTHRWMAVDRLPPLHHAAAVGDVEEIERLVAGGAAVDEQVGGLNTLPSWMDEDTPLRWAAARGHLRAAERLLDAGASPHDGVHGMGPLVAALGNGHDDIAEAMLPLLARTDTPADIDAILRHTSDAMRVRMLEHFEWDPYRLDSAACYAIMANDFACVELLVASGLEDTGDRPRSVLRYAASTDAMAWRPPYAHDLGLTRRVLELDLAGEEAAAAQAVETAIYTGCLPALDALLEAYPQHVAVARRLDAEDLASVALRAGRPMLARLIDLGVDLNAAPRDHFNALWYAAVSLEHDALAALLAHGVDPTLTADGQTLRQWLLVHRDQVVANPAAYPDHPFVTNAEAFARICDLLQAAELEWTARATTDPTPPTPGGP